MKYIAMYSFTLPIMGGVWLIKGWYKNGGIFIYIFFSFRSQKKVMEHKEISGSICEMYSH